MHLFFCLQVERHKPKRKTQGRKTQAWCFESSRFKGLASVYMYFPATVAWFTKQGRHRWAFGTPRLLSPCIRCLGCMCCIDMSQITTSSAGNENLLHNNSSYVKNILSDNENSYILYKKYVRKVVTHRNYNKHSKREILTSTYAAKRT